MDDKNSDFKSLAKNESAYASLGASATKAGLHKALKDAGVPEQAGLFAVINQDLAGDQDFASFMHCDGAGTKSIVAYLVYKDSGDIKAFSGLAQDALVMNLDDIFCLGSPQKLILGNIIQRNAHLVPDTAIQVILERYLELTKMLRSFGINIEFSGGETADCGDVVRTLLVDAVLSGRLKRETIINTLKIVPGDLIVGLSNTGCASYEQNENSSIGSNGLTLARHALLSKKYIELFPEVVDPTLPRETVYGGPYLTSDQPEELSMSIGAALLSPTRTYAPVLHEVLQRLSSNVHGIIHLSGGGQTKPLRFGKNIRYVKENFFPCPPLFALIQRYGKVSWEEMYQVFNMGHRLELYLPESAVQSVLETAASFQIEARVIGRVEASTHSGNEVLLKTPHGEFLYR